MKKEYMLYSSFIIILLGCLAAIIVLVDLSPPGEIHQDTPAVPEHNVLISDVEQLVNFTLIDSVTRKPIPSTLLVVTPQDGANAGRSYYWSSNMKGVAAIYAYLGETIIWNAAYGSEQYHNQSGELTISSKIRDITVNLVLR